MTPKQEELIKRGRRFIEAIADLYGREEADRIWLDLIKVLPDGQDIANEMLLDALKNGALPGEVKEQSAIEQELDYLRKTIQIEVDRRNDERERANQKERYEVQRSWIERDAYFSPIKDAKW